MTEPFGLPPEFFARLGYYVVVAGHIEHTLHEMLPGFQSRLFLQEEIKARKSRNTLLRAVRAMTKDLPADLAADVTIFCDRVDERFDYRNRAVHGAWFKVEGRPEMMNLHFVKGEAGHLHPAPMPITDEQIEAAIEEIDAMLVTAFELRDRIGALRAQQGDPA